MIKKPAAEALLGSDRECVAALGLHAGSRSRAFRGAKPIDRGVSG